MVKPALSHVTVKSLFLFAFGCFRTPTRRSKQPFINYSTVLWLFRYSFIWTAVYCPAVTCFPSLTVADCHLPVFSLLIVSFHALVNRSQIRALIVVSIGCLFRPLYSLDTMLVLFGLTSRSFIVFCFHFTCAVVPPRTRFRIQRIDQAVVGLFNYISNSPFAIHWFSPPSSPNVVFT